jgi:TruD family tRNA pseudouridine synthase
MAINITQEEHDRERVLFEAERKRVPELFVRAPMVDDDETLCSIGIEDITAGRPSAYLRLMPQDFIVEEVDRQGVLYPVNAEGGERQVDGDGNTYFANLIKVGISTLEAKSQIANILGIDEKNVGYAGIKDRLALTSQEISIRGVTDPEKISSLHADNFFLNDIRRGKGVVANGELKGNRFTITLRLAEPLIGGQRELLEQKIADAKTDGFWNFFYLQRFGTPRLISHNLGRLLIRGQYEETVKMFLTHIGARELPYFVELRKNIAEKWGDWKAIWEIIDRFPYHFSIERAFIAHLIDHPRDFLGALREVSDQVRLWFYAYDSYLFNKKLSALIRSGEVPLSLPFLTSFNPLDWKPYEEYLKEDGIVLPARSWRDFPFVRVESRQCATLQSIEIHGAVFDRQIAVVSFSLPKGSYATSFLMDLFSLSSGLPALPGISDEEVDAKEVIGEGTLGPVLEKFKKVLDQRRADIEGGGEE